ncbi:hypothetical protein Tco_0830646 [Tanacetum coccineum]
MKRLNSHCGSKRGFSDTKFRPESIADRVVATNGATPESLDTEPAPATFGPSETATARTVEKGALGQEVRESSSGCRNRERASQQNQISSQFRPESIADRVVATNGAAPESLDTEPAPATFGPSESLRRQRIQFKDVGANQKTINKELEKQDALKQN